MNLTIKHRLFRLLIVILLQLLIFSNMNFGYGFPIIIAYVTLKCHRGSSRESILVWGFVAGLIFDVFSNTMGKGMAVSTFMAMLQPYLLRLFSPNESVELFVPSFKSMGLDRYLYYVFATMFIFHLGFYLLESFSLTHLSIVFNGTITGTIATFLFVIISDLFIPKDKNLD